MSCKGQQRGARPYGVDNVRQECALQTSRPRFEPGSTSY